MIIIIIIMCIITIIIVVVVVVVVVVVSICYLIIGWTYLLCTITLCNLFAPPRFAATFSIEVLNIVFW